MINYCDYSRYPAVAMEVVVEVAEDLLSSTLSNQLKGSKKNSIFFKLNTTSK
jgi:predicted secreted protein